MPFRVPPEHDGAIVTGGLHGVADVVFPAAVHDQPARAVAVGQARVARAVGVESHEHHPLRARICRGDVAAGDDDRFVRLRKHLADVLAGVQREAPSGVGGKVVAPDPRVVIPDEDDGVGGERHVPVVDGQPADVPELRVLEDAVGGVGREGCFADPPTAAVRPMMGADGEDRTVGADAQPAQLGRVARRGELVVNHAVAAAERVINRAVGIEPQHEETPLPLRIAGGRRAAGGAEQDSAVVEHLDRVRVRRVREPGKVVGELPVAGKAGVEVAVGGVAQQHHAVVMAPRAAVIAGGDEDLAVVLERRAVHAQVLDVAVRRDALAAGAERGVERAVRQVAGQLELPVPLSDRHDLAVVLREQHVELVVGMQLGRDQSVGREAAVHRRRAAHRVHRAGSVGHRRVDRVRRVAVVIRVRRGRRAAG